MRACLVEVPAGGPILDVAGPAGGVAPWLTKQGFRVVAVTAAWSGLAGASSAARLHSGGPGPRLVVDPECLPFAECAFRAATLLGVLDGLPSPRRIGLLRAVGEAADLVIVDQPLPGHERLAAGLVLRRTVGAWPLLPGLLPGPFAVLERH